MNGQGFVRLVHEAFAPFLKSAGFSAPSIAISGRLYRASFSGQENMVSVSFEPGDDSLFVIVFSRTRGDWSAMDDREMSPRLSDLNTRYMSMIGPKERSDNETYFRTAEASDPVEKSLLKAAKELRLVLPMYLADQARQGRARD